MSTTTLTNVRVFDDTEFLPPGSVVIESGLITAVTAYPAAVELPADSTVIDCEGRFLLPGLIDAHVHLHGPQTLGQLADYGVTTAFDMASAPPAFVDSLRHVPGVTDILSAGTPAIAPGSTHSHIPVLGRRGLVTGPDQAAGFVADRIAEGSDYLKIVIGNPGPSHDKATLEALVGAAHEHGKTVVAHASSYLSVQLALDAGVDVLTHVPLDRALDQEIARRAAAEGRIVIPTLAMMEGIVEQSAPPGATYAASRQSVAELHRAGVPILAGTDANAAPGVPAAVRHGESLHRELELLVVAGLDPLEALRAATSLPARYFALPDRGAITPGLRADLLLLDADPLLDIRATRSLRRVWFAGVERTPATA
ncbi:MAG TPA: amidohydrolase family protein [Actinocrinis sp.]|nr:amidohydrolase family protein [Actinocrinis sp.]